MSQPEITDWLCPDRVFDGQSLHDGWALGLNGSTVVALVPGTEVAAAARCRRVQGTLVPGYLDLQVNGGGDVFLNTTPTARGMAAIAAAHRRFGTVGILPTVITDAPEVLARVVDAAIEAKGTKGVLGLHIEGPHLSRARRGTHAVKYLRPLDAGTLEHVRRLRAAGVKVMITVAPEAVQPGQVAALQAMGAIVSIGHTDATAEETRALLAEGANCFTHLYNAMSPMQNRAPGVTGACINSTAYAGIICDGHHVADEMVGLAVRARPLDRTFLVSDAMSTVGGSDHFTLYGQEIRLVDGKLVNAEGSLAGAHVTMAEGVQRLIRVVGVAPEQALRMATSIPATLIGAPELGGVIGRDLGDLLVLGPDWSVQQNGVAG